MEGSADDITQLERQLRDAEKSGLMPTIPVLSKRFKNSPNATGSTKGLWT